MGQPLQELTAGQLNLFLIGKSQYEHTFLASEGLGPIFNKASCGNCHNNPVGGTGSQTVTRFGFVDKGGFDPLAQFGGSLLQVSAISKECQEFVHNSANLESFRVTNGLLAYGLVEAIPDEDIEAVQAAQPVNQQGIVHYVTAFEDPKQEPPILHVGRFGWKAQVATVLTFSADAAQNELGISNRFVPFDNDPNGIDPPDLAACDTVADPEDGPALGLNGVDFIDNVTDFQRLLANAPQTPKAGMTGETLFNTIGCAVCHHPSYTTSNDPGLEDALRNKVIRPYSDFLLHYMGQTSDFIVQGAGIEGMIKTPPLWGLKVRDPIWHDGRFGAGTFESRVTDAIHAHDDIQSDPEGLSQGKFAADAFDGLDPSDQSKVLAFLKSLGQAEFDYFDAGGTVVINIDDFLGFADCYTGPVATYTADDACSIGDIDQDGDVDLDDFDSFLLVYDGPARDCNTNGVLDLIDILNGTATDADADAIPDSCEPTCEGDTNGSGSVTVDDLLAVINGWGACPALPAPCPGDIDADHTVDVDDLLDVINAWGVCP